MFRVPPADRSDRPKLTITRSRCRSAMMFEGLRSRWTTPRPWASSMARASRRTRAATGRWGKGWRPSNHLESGWPSSRGMVR